MAPEVARKSKKHSDKRARSGGKAGGLGYEFQSTAIAWFYSQILAGRSDNQLSAIDVIGDARPLAVAAETGSAGDDIVVEYSNGVRLEVQARRGLRSGSRLYEPLTKLIAAVAAQQNVVGAIVCDRTSSESIRRDLATDLVRIGQCREDDLTDAGARVIGKLALDVPSRAALARRLRILEISNVQPPWLATVFASPALSAHAWAHLRTDALAIIGLRGRRDLSDLILLLRGRKIALRAENTSSAALLEQYTNWRASVSETFTALGYQKALPVESSLPLRISFRDLNPSKDADRSVPNDCGPVQQYYGHQDSVRRSHTTYAAEYAIDFNRRVILIGGPGAGKSVLLRRIANRFAKRTLVVLHVRLREVAALRKTGVPFDETISKLSFDGTSNSAEEREELQRRAFVLLADGLDECGVAVGGITEDLTKWSSGHPNVRILVTSRPVGFEPSLFVREIWSIGDILPLDSYSHLRRLLDAMGVASEVSQSAIQAMAPRTRTRGDDRSSHRFRSPLLVSALASLIANRIDPPDTEAGLLRAVIDLFRFAPPTGRTSEPPHSASLCDEVLDLAGVVLRTDLSTPRSRLVDSLAAQLSAYIGDTRLRAAKLAEEALRYWEDRALLERLHVGQVAYVAFSHLQLCEFSAASFRAKQAKAAYSNFAKWVQKASSDPAQREVLRLLVEWGLLPEITQALLNDAEGSHAPVIAALELVCEHSKDEVLDYALRQRLETRLLTSIDAAPNKVADKCAELWLRSRWTPNVSTTNLAKRLLRSTSPRRKLRGWALRLIAGGEAISELFLEKHPRGQFRVDKSGKPSSGLHSILSLADPLYDQCIAIAVTTLLKSPKTAKRLAILQAVAKYKEYTSYTASELDVLAGKSGYEVNFSGETDWSKIFSPEYEKVSHRLDLWLLDLLRCDVLGDVSPQSPAENDTTDFRELGAIWTALGLDRVYADDFRRIPNADHRSGLAATIGGIIDNLGIDRRALLQQCVNIRSSLGDGHSVGFKLPDIPITSLSPLPGTLPNARSAAKELVNGIFHPFLGFSLAAANLVEAGVTNDHLSGFVESKRKYPWHTCYLVAQLCDRIWRTRASTALMKLLRLHGGERGAHYFAEKLLESYGGQTDVSLKGLVIDALLTEDGHEAGSLAALLQRFDSSVLDSESIRCAFDHWLANQKGISPEGELSYESPLVPLARLLASRRLLTNQDIALLSKVDRSEVSALAQQLKKEGAGVRPAVSAPVAHAT